MSHKDYPLSIRLAEPIVFLRTPETAIGRGRNVNIDAPPAMLRGLLTLHLTKPTRISSIEVDLEGKSVVHWVEAVAHRRIEIPEETKLLSAHAVIFSARSSPTRPASVGPRSAEYEDDDRAYRSSPRPSRTRLSRFSADSSNSLNPNLPDASYAARRNSADLYGWRRGAADSQTATLSSSRPPTPSASPPYTPELAPISLTAEAPPTPHNLTGTRPSDASLQSHHTSGSRSEEHPAQMLNEYRNALQFETGNVIRSTTFGTSPDPSLHSSESMPTTTPSISRTVSDQVFESSSSSRPVSRDGERWEPHTLTTSPTSPNGLNSPRSRPTTPFGHIASLRSPRTSTFPKLEHDNTSRSGHHPNNHSRWSLSSVLKDVSQIVRHTSPKDTDRHRGRSPGRNGSIPHIEFPTGTDEREAGLRDKERKKAIGKLTAAIGLDDTPHVDGWKEFQKGTYTYPVSFAIPANTPPTVHCEYGSVVYRLRAVVHRPGALTSKFVVSTEVLLVASPAEDGAEEAQSIAVEREWDLQLRYLIGVSGRSFPIGSQAPFTLTLFPLDKCKIYRVSAFLEEKTQYTSRNSGSVRQAPVKRWELLSIKHEGKQNLSPILPLETEHIPLLMPYLDTSTMSVDEALTSLMGSGPWTISHELQIPAECGRIRFTYKHKSTRINIQHVLRIIFRVGRADDFDPKTGKRRLFDIVVQAPITILSCHCSPEEIALPRYSLFGAEPGAAPIRNCACSGWTSRAAIPDTGLRVGTSPRRTPGNSRPSTAEGGTERANSSYQFARLLSGREDMLGDAPPQYAEVYAQR